MALPKLSRRLPGALVPATGLFFAWNSISRPKLEATQDDEDDGLAKARARAARYEEILKAAREFTSFVDRSPSAYHAVDTIQSYLLDRGFSQVHEKDDWTETLKPGGKHYVIRSGSSGSSIIAFAVGKLWEPGNPFSIVASHVDSPCLKIKPVSDRTSAGFRQVGVETYGGGLWHTWFDRDLGVAGRAFVRTSPEKIESVLVRLDEPILRIPTLAVHWDRQNPFSLDLERHLLPVLGLKVNEPSTEVTIPSQVEQVFSKQPWVMVPANKRHSTRLIDKLAEKLGVHPNTIMEFDLSLYDLQKPSLGGINDEFIFSQRIDNLMMTFCSLKGFVDSLKNPAALDEETSVRMYASFDNEEIGSTGPLAAQSTFLPSTIKRLAGDKYAQSVARSLLISADVIHASHPNYHGYHDVNHTPALNAGLVMSSTSRKFLAKSTPSLITMLELICKIKDTDGTIRGDIESEPPKSQFFVMANGRDCGSTVGPHLEARLGMRVIEMGNSMLSMHSIREMAGSHDVDNAIRFLRLFYENYSAFEEWVVVH